jgi:hypothetical protein
MQSQTPIDCAIASALVAATPESWRAALLVAERRVEGAGESFQIAIANPEGLQDLVSATPEVMEHVKALSDLHVQHQRPWIRLSFAVSQMPAGGWRYQADFVYSS